jgi:hypothetical protein
MPVPVLTEVGYLLEREKGARAEAEFLRSIRAGQVMMGHSEGQVVSCH